MAPAHVEFLVDTAHINLPRAGRIFLDSPDELCGDQGVSVHAQEPVAEFLFQIYDWFAGIRGNWWGQFEQPDHSGILLHLVLHRLKN